MILDNSLWKEIGKDYFRWLEVVVGILYSAALKVYPFYYKCNSSHKIFAGVVDS